MLRRQRIIRSRLAPSGCQLPLRSCRRRQAIDQRVCQFDRVRSNDLGPKRLRRRATFRRSLGWPISMSQNSSVDHAALNDVVDGTIADCRKWIGQRIGQLGLGGGDSRRA